MGGGGEGGAIGAMGGGFGFGFTAADAGDGFRFDLTAAGVATAVVAAVAAGETFGCLAFDAAASGITGGEAVGCCFSETTGATTV